MSDSPWDGDEIFRRIQEEVKVEANFSGGMLTLDDSGNQKSGNKSAGAARQYIGRLGKTEMGQVGVVVGYFKNYKWTLLDSELYFPKIWFNKEHENLKKRWHVPSQKTFKSKIDIAMEMIYNAKKNGVPFSIVGCDNYYGKDITFRRKLDNENIKYIAAVRANCKVYLTRPIVSWREPKRKCKRDKIMEITGDSVKVGKLLESVQLESVFVRHCERGSLYYDCAQMPVYTVDKLGNVQREILIIRKEKNEQEKYTFALSNLDISTPKHELIFWRCARFFVERTIQDCKDELGWDELQALKYRAWKHHISLIALALWFSCKVKIEFEKDYPRDPVLNEYLALDVLPRFSLPNIRSVLRVLFPFISPSLIQIQNSIVQTFVERARSTASRLRLASG